MSRYGDAARGPAPADATTRGTARTHLIGFAGIREAALAVGVSPSTVRLWERQGLVAPVRTRGGVRRFGPGDLDRLHAIRRLRSVDGLNAPAIRRVLPPAQQATANGSPTTALRSVPDAGRPRPRSTMIEPRPGGPGQGTPAGRNGAGDRTRAIARGGASISARLRDIRRERGMTLRQAATLSDLSVSFISALERGLTGASITALRRLVAAYGTTLGSLLDPGVREGHRLVPAGARHAAETGTGIRIENLADRPTSLEPQLFTLEPGATSHGTYTHPGEEFLYVLEGSLGVWLDATEEFYRLGTGDALTFASTLPHRFKALGTAETRLIWVNTPPTF